eukprot:scaffold176393_cov31-Tisochrysis_lutea.AAC.1
MQADLALSQCSRPVRASACPARGSTSRAKRDESEMWKEAFSASTVTLSGDSNDKISESLVKKGGTRAALPPLLEDEAPRATSLASTSASWLWSSNPSIPKSTP